MDTNEWERLPSPPLPLDHFTVVMDEVDDDDDLVAAGQQEELKVPCPSLVPVKLASLEAQNGRGHENIVLLARLASRGIVLTKYLPLLYVFREETRLVEF